MKILKDERKDKKMKERIKGWTNERLKEWKKELKDEKMKGWKNERKN